MGAHYVIYIPAGYRDQRGSLVQPPTLDADAWKRLVSRASEMGRTLQGDYGVRLVFHPHADTDVETQEQVERFLEDTEASAVSLCLDTGHISYCGGDNLALIEEFPDRISYVHLKQVLPDVLAQVRSEELGFATAVQRGAMCEPPNGIPDFEPLIAALRRLDTDLFAIVSRTCTPVTQMTRSRSRTERVPI